MPRRVGIALVRALIFVGAAVLIVLLFQAAGLRDEGWAITSAALVLQTGAQASLHQAVLRVAANLLGAIIALLALKWYGSSIAGLAIALFLVGLICQVTKLEDSLRSAYVCVIIIMGVDRFAGVSPPIDRVSAVVIGAAVGVGVSWLTPRITRRLGLPDH